jgi:hypothetical protein
MQDEIGNAPHSDFLLSLAHFGLEGTAFAQLLNADACRRANPNSEGADTFEKQQNVSPPMALYALPTRFTFFLATASERTFLFFLRQDCATWKSAVARGRTSATNLCPFQSLGFDLLEVESETVN